MIKTLETLNRCGTRSWCVTKQKAKLIIGVMYNLEHEGSSSTRARGIKFNAHREYGNVRYPYFYLATNWRLLWRHPVVGVWTSWPPP